jgi:hypothetical protein
MKKGAPLGAPLGAGKDLVYLAMTLAISSTLHE